MKTITKTCIAGIALSAALLASTDALADTLAYFPNQVGGTIQLTDARCATGNGLMTGSVDSSGELVAAGCWHYSEPNIVVVWDTGGMRFYSPSIITMTEAGKRATADSGKRVSHQRKSM
jgi:hypothetical protein